MFILYPILQMVKRHFDEVLFEHKQPAAMLCKLNGIIFNSTQVTQFEIL